MTHNAWIVVVRMSRNLHTSKITSVVQCFRPDCNRDEAIGSAVMDALVIKKGFSVDDVMTMQVGSESEIVLIDTDPGVLPSE